MKKDEFLYDYDLGYITYMVNRYISENFEDSKDDDVVSILDVL